MSTATKTSEGIDARIVREGYGDGAWHGPDLKAALAGVTEERAFSRPGPGRHSIAEIAMHHAYCVHVVRAKVGGGGGEPFPLEGEDWFELSPAVMAWPRVLDVVSREQEALAATAADLDAGRVRSPLGDAERFDLILGITCHAVYHAGQIQLIKVLADR